MKEIKQYDPENRLNALYKAGKMQHYEQNLCSVMCEKIKSNCEIATELAWRDWQIELLQARIKELESDKYINEIKAQGIEEAVTKADSETYIGLPNQCFPPQKQYKAELLCFAEQLRTIHEQIQKTPINPTNK